MSRRKLNAAARDLLREHRISAAKWTRIQFGGSEWFGDACGCNDDRCIGFHHDAAAACGCLPAMIGNYYRDLAASAAGLAVWDLHLRALGTGTPADREAADVAAAGWIRTYYPAAVSWSLTEAVGGRQGITIRNRFNDQRWLIWAADSGRVQL